MLPHNQLIVVGASGFGRESLDVIAAMNEDGAYIDVVGVVDDAPSQENMNRLADRGVEYLGTIDNWLAKDVSNTNFILGIGNPRVRHRLAQQLENAGLRPFSAIHPTAVIGSRPDFGPGVVVCAGAVISTNVRLGRHVHINPSSTIGHDAVLGDFVSVNPGAVVSGEVTVENEALLGAQSIVLQGLRIGARSVVGAMACVTKDVPRNVTAKGVPAHVEANSIS